MDLDWLVYGLKITFRLVIVDCYSRQRLGDKYFVLNLPIAVGELVHMPRCIRHRHQYLF